MDKCDAAIYIRLFPSLTPNYVYTVLQRTAHISDLSQLRHLVLDEADRMAEKNHFADLTSILAVLPPPAPKQVCHAVVMLDVFLTCTGRWCGG